MNEKDRKTAKAIWPEKMDDRYKKKRDDALNWLGDRYLLAAPINRKAA